MTVPIPDPRLVPAVPVAPCQTCGHIRVWRGSRWVCVPCIRIAAQSAADRRRAPGSHSRIGLSWKVVSDLVDGRNNPDARRVDNSTGATYTEIAIAAGMLGIDDIRALSVKLNEPAWKINHALEWARTNNFTSGRSGMHVDWTEQLHRLLLFTAAGILELREDATGRAGYGIIKGPWLDYEQYNELGALLRPAIIVVDYIDAFHRPLRLTSFGHDLANLWLKARPSHHQRFTAEADRLHQNPTGGTP